ncbi:pyridoxamine 5'-phosphate oxidase family protein [Streptomyces apocyni]|uniref:pyridoxamine 5'-phosphate oxidase family protein n=1 Tax=Streptomyces apocyni TaxID=2654677 RepID=UPI0012EAE964|nr:pyridoxamine 5'-phosphate oxidase family protein [Streptomyces apocyni]
MALTREEREQFLAEPHIAALAVDGGEGRAPLTVPIWYQYEPGGDIWVLTGQGSRKHELLAAAGRFTLMVDRVTPTIRYVSVEGPILEIAPGTHDQLVEMSSRYLPADKVDDYVKYSEETLGENVIIRMRPQRWLSSDLGSV